MFSKSYNLRLGIESDSDRFDLIRSNPYKFILNLNLASNQIKSDMICNILLDQIWIWIDPNNLLEFIAAITVVPLPKKKKERKREKKKI